MHAQADKTDWHALESKVYHEISAGHFAHATRILCDRRGWEAHAACLNLRGAIHELLGETSGAMMCYGAAVRADPDYEPGIRNFRRLYEIRMFGRSDGHLVIGENHQAVQ